MVGRPREFDRDAALEAAMGLFWRQGFEATSVDDLLEEMGIQRGSLYAAFGDKRSLYLEALRAYVERGRAFFRGKLEGGPPLSKLRAFVRHWGVMAEAGDGNGCLLINALNERGAEDPDVREICGLSTQMAEDALYEKLVAARDAGELTNTESPRALARFLVLTFHGFILLSKQRAPRAVIQDNLRVVLSHLH